MEYWKIILIPLIGFLIGYVTNYIAIRMLFHPKRKWFGFQGVLPARKKILARNISEAAINVLPRRVKELSKIPFIGEKIMDLIKDGIEKEINSLNDDELERIVLRVVSRELKFITWMGGILGLLIGLLQVLVIMI